MGIGCRVWGVGLLRFRVRVMIRDRKCQNSIKIYDDYMTSLCN